MRKGELLADPKVLKSAAVGYENSLNVFTKEGEPKFWLMIQGRLAESLLKLGEFSQDTSEIDKAIKTFQALETFAQSQGYELEKAVNQCNKAIALNARWEITGEEDDLLRAVVACRAATTSLPRSKWPHTWGMLQSNLASVLADVAKSSEIEGDYRRSIEAFNHALVELAPSISPNAWAGANQNFANLLVEYGVIFDDVNCHKRAVRAYRDALVVFARSALPTVWGEIQNDLGTALQEIGKTQTLPIEERTVALMEAIYAYSLAVEIYSMEINAQNFAVTQQKKAESYMTLAELRGDAFTGKMPWQVSNQP